MEALKAARQKLIGIMDEVTLNQILDNPHYQREVRATVLAERPVHQQTRKLLELIESSELKSNQFIEILFEVNSDLASEVGLKKAAAPNQAAPDSASRSPKAPSNITQPAADFKAQQPSVPQQESRPAGPVPWVIPSTAEFVTHTQEKEADSIYKIQDKASRQRLALIINNIEFEKAELKRNGAQQDQDQMKKLLEELGYSVELHNDQSAQEMESTLSLFSQREEHTKSDSTFVVLMSHGFRDGICGKLSKDEKTDILKTDKIFDIFNTKNCAGLRGKPKVIIIQACRGGEDGYALVSDSIVAPEPIQDSLEDDCQRKEHKEKDFICFCSSTPDTKSMRHPVEGTIFIQRLVETFCKNACRDHIEELFIKVQRTFQDFQLQMPTRERTTLLKKFYLFPGN